MKIVVLDGYTLNPGDLSWGTLKCFGEVTLYDRTKPSEDNIIERIGDSEIILTNKTPLSKETLDKVPLVKYIGVLATGYNVVDVCAAKKSGILVTNIPSYGTDAVAQFTFGLILELCHQIGKHDIAVKKGEWTTAPDFSFWKSQLTELSGKTIGIIGFGRIGQATAKIAIAFGMKVLANSRTQKTTLLLANCEYVILDKLYAESDFITLHCPLTEATQNIINKDSIAKMKKSAMLINTSRGPLINEQDLCDALNDEVIKGAAVDVVTKEPIEVENPLLKAKNCIITPHIAWASKESRQRLMDMAVSNLAAFLDNRPQNIVS